MIISIDFVRYCLSAMMKNVFVVISLICLRLVFDRNAFFLAILIFDHTST